MGTLQMIFAWIKKLLSKKVIATIAVKLVNEIKDLVNSEGVKAMVDYTATTKDNEYLAKVTAVMDDVYKGFLIAEGVIDKLDEPRNLLPLVIEYLKNAKPESRRKFWVDLAARIAEALSDGTITFAEASSITQLIWARLFGGK
jgi:hypothetical protein